MSNFWQELDDLVSAARKASSRNSAADYQQAYAALLQHLEHHKPLQEAAQ